MLQERVWEVKRMLTAFHRAVKRRADEEDAEDGEDAESDPQPD